MEEAHRAMAALRKKRATRRLTGNLSRGQLLLGGLGLTVVLVILLMRCGGGDGGGNGVPPAASVAPHGQGVAPAPLPTHTPYPTLEPLPPLPTHTPYPTATPYPTPEAPAPLPTHTPYPTLEPLPPLPTHTPYPTATPYPTPEAPAPLPTHTPYPTLEPLPPLPTHTPYPTATPYPTHTPYPTPTLDPRRFELSPLKGPVGTGVKITWSGLPAETIGARATIGLQEIQSTNPSNCDFGHCGYPGLIYIPPDLSPGRYLIEIRVYVSVSGGSQMAARYGQIFEVTE